MRPATPLLNVAPERYVVLEFDTAKLAAHMPPALLPPEHPALGIGPAARFLAVALNARVAIPDPADDAAGKRFVAACGHFDAIVARGRPAADRTAGRNVLHDLAQIARTLDINADVLCWNRRDGVNGNQREPLSSEVYASALALHQAAVRDADLVIACASHPESRFQIELDEEKRAVWPGKNAAAGISGLLNLELRQFAGAARLAHPAVAGAEFAFESAQGTARAVRITAGALEGRIEAGLRHTHGARATNLVAAGDALRDVIKRMREIEGKTLADVRARGPKPAHPARSAAPPATGGKPRRNDPRSYIVGDVDTRHLVSTYPTRGLAVDHRLRMFPPKARLIADELYRRTAPGLSAPKGMEDEFLRLCRRFNTLGAGSPDSRVVRSLIVAQQGMLSRLRHDSWAGEWYRAHLRSPAGDTQTMSPLFYEACELHGQAANALDTTGAVAYYPASRYELPLEGGDGDPHWLDENARLRLDAMYPIEKRQAWAADKAVANGAVEPARILAWTAELAGVVREAAVSVRTRVGELGAQASGETRPWAAAQLRLDKLIAAMERREHTTLEQLTARALGRNSQPIAY